MNQIVKLRQIFRNQRILLRQFHDEFQNKEPPIVKNSKTSTVPAAISLKYKMFQESDSPVILDIDEERQRIRDGDLDYDGRPKVREMYEGLNLKSKNHFY